MAYSRLMVVSRGYRTLCEYDTIAAKFTAETPPGVRHDRRCRTVPALAAGSVPVARPQHRPGQRTARARPAALQAAGFPPGQLRVTTILNLADAAWGTRGFVLGELESNKKKHPEAVLVADEAGAGLSHWQLAEKNSAIAVIAPDGAIALFHEGPLDKAGIDQVLTMIQGWIDTQ